MMKKIILSFLFLAICFTISDAQIIGPLLGRVFASGSVGITSSSKPAANGNAHYNTATATFSPAIGYFISKSMAVGGRLNFTREKLTGYTEGHSKGVEAFFRYYETKNFAEGKISAFGEAAFGYSKSNDSYLTFGGTKTETATIAFKLSPGVSFFPSKLFGIELTLPTVFGISSSTPQVSSTLNGLPNNYTDATTTSYQFGFSSISGTKITVILFII